MSAFKPLPGAQLNLDHPLARGLVGCWLMNENSGKYVHDYSGQNNEGTLVGFNDPPIATSGWNAGPHGGALAFDGAGDYVNLPLVTKQINNVTLIAWFKTNNYLQAGQIVIYNGGAGRTNGFGFAVNNEGSTTGEIKILYGAVAWYSTGIIVDNNQHCGVLVVKSNGNPDFYLDGVLRYVGGAGTPVIPTLHTQIGMDDFGIALKYFSGLISSASIYNRALSAEEIAYLYAFPYCMFDEPAYPAWMRKHVSAQDYYRHLLAGSGY